MAHFLTGRIVTAAPWNNQSGYKKNLLTCAQMERLMLACALESLSCGDPSAKWLCKSALSPPQAPLVKFTEIVQSIEQPSGFGFTSDGESGDEAAAAATCVPLHLEPTNEMSQRIGLPEALRSILPTLTFAVSPFGLATIAWPTHDLRLAPLVTKRGVLQRRRVLAVCVELCKCGLDANDRRLVTLTYAVLFDRSCAGLVPIDQLDRWCRLLCVGDAIRSISAQCLVEWFEQLSLLCNASELLIHRDGVAHGAPNSLRALSLRRQAFSGLANFLCGTLLLTLHVWATQGSSIVALRTMIRTLYESGGAAELSDEFLDTLASSIHAGVFPSIGDAAELWRTNSIIDQCQSFA